MPVRTRAAERYARAVAAALAAVACLLLAANAGPTDSAHAPAHEIAPPAEELASSDG
ncbi:hypothetical protein ABZV87_11915 [Streptomyces tendae]|uniref:hypothetical protein n=1 Tax=Streptomyces tendae TaxID=1932 RepID=UPI0033AD249E